MISFYDRLKLFYSKDNQLIIRKDSNKIKFILGKKFKNIVSVLSVLIPSILTPFIVQYLNIDNQVILILLCLMLFSSIYILIILGAFLLPKQLWLQILPISN